MIKYLKKCVVLLFPVLMICAVCGSEYTFVQPDKIEYPGDEFKSLFPTFVMGKSTESRNGLKIYQSRYKYYCTLSLLISNILLLPTGKKAIFMQTLYMYFHTDLIDFHMRKYRKSPFFSRQFSLTL